MDIVHLGVVGLEGTCVDVTHLVELKGVCVDMAHWEVTWLEGVYIGWLCGRHLSQFDARQEEEKCGEDQVSPQNEGECVNLAVHANPDQQTKKESPRRSVHDQHLTRSERRSLE